MPRKPTKPSVWPVVNGIALFAVAVSIILCVVCIFENWQQLNIWAGLAVLWSAIFWFISYLRMSA